MTATRECLDIIGDVHGCFDELEDLLERLGYRLCDGGATPPAGRKALFLGDLVDRGPKAVEVCRLVMAMVERGDAECLLGNHELQMLHYFRGKTRVPRWGLPETLAQLARVEPEFTGRLRAFAESLPPTRWIDHRRALAVHAGMPEDLQHEDARTHPAARRFALYGGYPEDDYRRRDWTPSYRGDALVIYGHTPAERADWRGNTICLDTGCVYGGALTALRYPELEVVTVPARRVHYQGV